MNKIHGGGYTWHYISADIDAGAIIIQEKIKITEQTTSFTFLKQCEMLALKSFDNFLPFEMIENFATQQTVKNEKLASPKRSTEIPNNGMLDLSWSISKQVAFLNAMNYGVTYILGKPKVMIEGNVRTIVGYEFGNKLRDNRSYNVKKNLYNIYLTEGDKELVIWIKR